jgi:hypothetical protein
LSVGAGSSPGEPGDTVEGGGADYEGLRVPDSGSISEASEDAGRPAASREIVGSDSRRGLGDRRGSNPSFSGEHPVQENFPPVGVSLEVVGYSWKGATLLEVPDLVSVRAL